MIAAFISNRTLSLSGICRHGNHHERRSGRDW
jgi:hypothetical protein